MADQSVDAPHPDDDSRASASPFSALTEADFHAEFHRRFPTGVIVPDGEELTSLITSAVELGGKKVALEAHVASQKAELDRRAEGLRAAQRLAGEVAIRRFLDDVAEAGLPSTLYQTFRPEYREYIGRKLTYFAERANTLLGQYHALTPEAIADRDARYADRDGEEPDTGGLADDVRRLFESAFEDPEDEPDAE